MGEYDYLFTDKTISSNTQIEGKVKTKRELKHESRMLSRHDELSKLFPEIEKNVSYHLISSDNFGSIELLRVLSEREDIKYIGITTWSYNKDFVELIRQLLGKGIQIEFFVDKSMRTRKTSLYAQMVNMKDIFSNLAIKVHHMIHSKITIIESVKHKIAIEASANYSNNQRIENFTITENEDLFNFHKDWMNEIIGK